MLGFSALGQFALGQASIQDVISATFILDDSASPERRKKRRKQQEDAVAEIAAKKEQLRGDIYDAIHPPQELVTPQLDASIFARPSYPMVLPNDPMVGSILQARMMEQRQRQMLADQEDENDIEMLLRG